MSFPIENLRMWRSGNWVKYELRSSHSILRIQYDQLLITAENKILESLNLNGKVKGILKNDVLILIINIIGQEELSAHFPVVTYGSVVSKNKISLKYRKLEDILKDAVEGKSQLKPSIIMPTEFKNFVKLCLLDPLFPQVLIETEKILESVL